MPFYPVSDGTEVGSSLFIDVEQDDVRMALSRGLEGGLSRLIYTVNDKAEYGKASFNVLRFAVAVFNNKYFGRHFLFPGQGREQDRAT